VETPVAELLNSLRTAAFAKDGRETLLGGLDVIESIFRSMQRQLEADHDRMADREQKLAEAFDRIRLAEEKIFLLEEQIRLDMTRKFGRSSERWKADERLQALLFDELELAVKQAAELLAGDASATLAPHAPRRRRAISGEGADGTHGGRKPLPASLPRRETVLDIPEGEKICAACGKQMARIGEDVNERLCLEPVKFFVERTVRPSYGCACGCGGMHAAPVKQTIIPKSIASPSLLAQVVTSKFCDALPFYRQSNILERDGIDISRATMARWAMQAHTLLSPMTEIIRQMIRTSAVMNMDETRVRVLHENGTKKDGLSWMWCAAATVELPDAEGLHRDLKLITFHYAPGRDHEVAEELLAGFKGTLMSDAYAAYNGPSKNAGIVQAACMAHVRRKYHDVLKIEKGNQKAQYAMGFIKALYDIEREHADEPPDLRLKARQEKSRPIMDKFWEWLVAEAACVIPGSTLGKAINYTIPLWSRLKVFLDDGRVPIDNNLVENGIRPFTVGRRNWLFYDQSEGAEASTSFYTLIETAKANGIEPMHYLRFLFNCIEHFGHDHMPWEKLMPTPAIRQFAESVGIPYNMAL
jgi:transposase